MSMAAARKNIPRKFIERSCDSKQKLQITQGLRECKTPGQKLKQKFVPGYNYQISLTQWFGKDLEAEGYLDPVAMGL